MVKLKNKPCEACRACFCVSYLLLTVFTFTFWFAQFLVFLSTFYEGINLNSSIGFCRRRKFNFQTMLSSFGLGSNGEGVNSIGLLFVWKSFACGNSGVRIQSQGNGDGHLRQILCFWQIVWGEETSPGVPCSTQRCSICTTGSDWHHYVCEKEAARMKISCPQQDSENGFVIGVICRFLKINFRPSF